MAVPEVFEGIYRSNVVFMLLKTTYGLKNAAKTFWRELLKSFATTGCRIINADPCMYFRCTLMVLSVWFSWINECLRFRRDDEVEESRKKIMNLFDCGDYVNMDSYVGCKINGEYCFAFTQPVMLQSFSD